MPWGISRDIPVIGYHQEAALLAAARDQLGAARGSGRTFDLVAFVATVHHLPDLHAGLHRLADLTAPCGALVVTGLACSTTLWDHMLSVAGIVQHQ